MIDSFRSYKNASIVALSISDLIKSHPSQNLNSDAITISSESSDTSLSPGGHRSPRQNTILRRIYSRITRRLQPHYSRRWVNRNYRERTNVEPMEMVDELGESMDAFGVQSDNGFDNVIHIVSSSSQQSSLRHPWLWRNNNFRIRRDGERSRFQRVPFFRSLREHNIFRLQDSPTVSDFTTDQSSASSNEEREALTDPEFPNQHHYPNSLYWDPMLDDSVEIEYRSSTNMVEGPIHISGGPAWMTITPSRSYQGQDIQYQESERFVMNSDSNFNDLKAKLNELEYSRSNDLYQMLGRFEDYYSHCLSIKGLKRGFTG